ncbi:MAG: hypothetical protein AB7R77_12650 [Ilumatobacteraceae bacterium]
MTITATFQAELDGVVIGRDTDYELAAAPQGFGLPEFRVSDHPLPFRDGEMAADDLLAARKLVFDVWVLGTTDADAEANLAALRAAWRPRSTDVELRVRLADTEYAVFGRPRGCQAAIDFLRNGRTARARLEFKALDPRLYSASTTDAALTLATVAGTGMTFPLTFDLSFGGALSGGIVTATNAGLFATPWVATLNGDLVNPTLENVTTGEILSFTGTLNAGETLVIDQAARTVLLNGTSSRYSWVDVGSTFFDLEPGDNQIRLAADSGSGSGTLTYRSAWA